MQPVPMLLLQSTTPQMLRCDVRLEGAAFGQPTHVPPQMLVVTERDAAAPSHGEARHGVTPPMRDARARHFRVQPDVPAALVAKTEQDLLAILAVRSPHSLWVHNLQAARCSLQAGCLCIIWPRSAVLWTLVLHPANYAFVAFCRAAHRMGSNS